MIFMKVERNFLPWIATNKTLGNDCSNFIKVEKKIQNAKECKIMPNKVVYVPDARVKAEPTGDGP